MLCILVTPELLYSCSRTVIIRCALRGTLLCCPVVHVLLLWSTVPVFRHILLLWWYSSRKSWLTSYYIVVPLVLHSRSPWTLLYSYGADYTGQWFDNDLMISTTADHRLWISELSLMSMIILNDAWMMLWWFLLLLPIMDSIYLTCQLRRWLIHDVVVMSSSTLLLTLSSFAVPPGDVAVVEVMICRVRAPVQLRADEYLLRRWWVSRLQPLTPSELDKQFVSDRWTLEEDDDPDSSLPDLPWLNFVYCNHSCIIVSEHPVCLSVCHPTRCRVADVVFAQHLSCI